MAQYTLISYSGIRHVHSRGAWLVSKMGRDDKGTLSIVIFDGTWMVTGFGWNITSVFFRLIVSPNRWAALTKELVILTVVDWVCNECTVINKQQVSDK